MIIFSVIWLRRGMYVPNKELKCEGQNTQIVEGPLQWSSNLSGMFYSKYQKMLLSFGTLSNENILSSIFLHWR